MTTARSTGRETILQIDGLQKVMADVFAHNWPRTPVVHVGIQVNVAAADALRHKVSAETGTRITMMTVIQKCAAMAAMDYPVISGLFDGEDTTRVIIPHPDDIAISGPVMIGETATPVLVEAASSKPLASLATEMADIVEDLRTRQLGHDDALANFHRIATTPNIGISNIGMMGRVNFFTAMNITPSLCALYVPATIMTPLVMEDGSILAAPCINFCLAFDHRVIAGGPAAAYLDRFKTLMENPERSLS